MIAFMGISGAGKSTLLEDLFLSRSYHVVSASELIKKQVRRQNTEAMSSEQMRLSATEDMQATHNPTSRSGRVRPSMSRYGCRASRLSNKPDKIAA